MESKSMSSSFGESVGSAVGTAVGDRMAEHQVSSGMVPELDVSQAKKAPPLPANHPYRNGFLRHGSSVAMILIYCATVAGVMVSVGWLQQLIFAGDAILFENTLAVFASFFPAIFLVLPLMMTLFVIATKKSNSLAEAFAYEQIVRTYQRLYDVRAPIERLITSQQVEQFNRGYIRMGIRVSVLFGVIGSILYAVVIVSFAAVYPDRIVDYRFPFGTKSVANTEVERISVSLRLSEDDEDGSLSVKESVFVYYPTEEEDDNGAYTNLCVFGCYQNQEAILATIARIRQESGAPLVVESLQVYEREWMQQNDPEAFKIWETFVTIE